MLGTGPKSEYLAGVDGVMLGRYPRVSREGHVVLVEDVGGASQQDVGVISIYAERRVAPAKSD